MSSTNQRFVQELYAAFKRGDIATILDALAPDASWAMVGRAEDVPMAGLRHGKAGAAEFFRIMAETVEIMAFEPRSFLTADDKVIVWGDWRWAMRQSGRRGENEWLHVFTIRDGKVVSWRGHNDTALLAAAYRGTPDTAPSEPRALVEAMVAAFQHGDIPSVVAQFVPDCPLRETQARDMPYAGTIMGAGKFFDLLLGAIEPSSLAIDRYICQGEDVVALGSWGGKARSTDKSFESNLALCFRIRGGKVIEFRGYDDTAVIAAALRP